MIWQPEFTDKTLSRKPGAVQPESRIDIHTVRKAADRTIQKMGLPSLTDEIWRDYPDSVNDDGY
ncbi:PerC family transcriptional regulator [Escherichia sp. WS1450]|uniref:PerC family transcriptional regulator n=1 Tax=Escherichia sp. WS1450 TaxID=3381940 RepID=UPI00396F6926